MGTKVKPRKVVGNCSLYLGDAARVLRVLPAGSVQACVTSPPYWGLRSYLANDHADKQLELGTEKTPQEYVARLVQVFRRARRLLHATGTLWVNVGDSYAGGGRGVGGRLQKTNKGSDVNPIDVPPGLTAGQLCGVPWLFAEAMRTDGWRLRADCIWVKLSPMPESVSGWRWEQCRRKTQASRGAKPGSKHDAAPIGGGYGARKGGEFASKAKWEPCPGCPKCEPHGGLVLRKGRGRPTRAHEYLFLFAKSDRYFYDLEASKQPARLETVMRDRYTWVLDDPEEQFAVQHDHETQCHGMANARSWLVFKGESLKEKHYAAYPPGLPEFCIRASTSSKGQCPYCGMPWARVADTVGHDPHQKKGYTAGTGARRDGDRLGHYTDGVTKTLGWRSCCACPPHEPVPQLVLDPFNGAGSTGVACVRAHRRYAGVDLNADYLDMAARRLSKAWGKRGLGLFT